MCDAWKFNISSRCGMLLRGKFDIPDGAGLCARGEKCPGNKSANSTVDSTSGARFRGARRALCANTRVRVRAVTAT